MSTGRERRRFQRYVLPSMYTEVAVRSLDDTEFMWKGHAYDISGGGMRFEIDAPIEPGTTVAIRIMLPGAQHVRTCDRRAVYAFANVVWIEEDDLDQPGPVRMACVFSSFVQPGDQDRLMERLRSGRFSQAA